MGELEYYVIAPDDNAFPASDQRGYHESAPFAKFNDFRVECMQYIARTGGQIKYGHSEVGNFRLGDMIYEQNEIEFLPVDARRAADQLALAKWVIRNLGNQYGYDITFAPKITTGKAGSGLHIHMRIVDADGKNMMVDADRRLSDTARRAIAGLMDLARPLRPSATPTPRHISALFPTRKHRPTFAGATATALSSCACLWAGPPTATCAPP